MYFLANYRNLGLGMQLCCRIILVWWVVCVNVLCLSPQGKGWGAIIDDRWISFLHTDILFCVWDILESHENRFNIHLVIRNPFRGMFVWRQCRHICKIKTDVVLIRIKYFVSFRWVWRNFLDRIIINLTCLDAKSLLIYSRSNTRLKMKRKKCLALLLQQIDIKQINLLKEEEEDTVSKNK